jgi:L-alanine-DL-glutamate epimerase-like enolase superfamily enzyme
VSSADPVITRVDVITLPTRYPRAVGRNARLGSHGSGGTSTAVIVSTASGPRGWGLVEQPSAAAQTQLLVGRPLSELIDPATGVREKGLTVFDAALHDLLGQVHDVPVYELLGSRGETTIEVYDGAIYFDDLDPETEPRGVAALLEECRADWSAGYRSFKLKIGRGHRWLGRAEGDRQDVMITRAVAEAFPEARILVDANDGYDVEGFCSYLDAVADVDLYWVEEPFPDDAADLAQLRRHLNEVSPATRIADGELDPDLVTLLPIAQRGDLDVLLMDVMSFGITRWRETMPAVREAGVVASPHAWGRPLKTLYAAQLAAGLGSVDVVEGVPGVTGGVDTSGYGFVDGRLTVPDRPGFGLPVPDV